VERTAEGDAPPVTDPKAGPTGTSLTGTFLGAVAIGVIGYLLFIAGLATR
jgi:hypothetical protein